MGSSDPSVRTGLLPTASRPRHDSAGYHCTSQQIGVGSLHMKYLLAKHHMGEDPEELR